MIRKEDDIKKILHYVILKTSGVSFLRLKFGCVGIWNNVGNFLDHTFLKIQSLKLQKLLNSVYAFPNDISFYKRVAKSKSDV